MLRLARNFLAYFAGNSVSREVELDSPTPSWVALAFTQTEVFTELEDMSVCHIGR